MQLPRNMARACEKVAANGVVPQQAARAIRELIDQGSDEHGKEATGRTMVQR
jgi:hypothetical protein